MFDRSRPARNGGWLTLTVTLIVQAAAAFAGNPPPDGKTFGDSLGLQVHFDQGEPPAHLVHRRPDQCQAPPDRQHAAADR